MKKFKQSKASSLYVCTFSSFFISLKNRSAIYIELTLYDAYKNVELKMQTVEAVARISIEIFKPLVSKQKRDKKEKTFPVNFSIVDALDYFYLTK